MVKMSTRTITVRVDSIELYDDSDFTGSGEIRFDMRVNGGTASRIYQNLNMGSGTTVKNLNIVRTYLNLPPELAIQVRGQDDDCEASTCTVSTPWGNGSNGDVQWATGTANVVLPTNSGGDGTFFLQGDGGGLGQLGFRINGTWSVRYTRT